MVRVFFDLIPFLTSMAGRITLMQVLTPLVVAAAAWHAHKLKKLKKSGKTTVTLVASVSLLIYCCVCLASVARQQKVFPYHGLNTLAIKKH